MYPRETAMLKNNWIILCSDTWLWGKADQKKKQETWVPGIGKQFNVYYRRASATFLNQVKWHAWLDGLGGEFDNGKFRRALDHPESTCYDVSWVIAHRTRKTTQTMGFVEKKSDVKQTWPIGGKTCNAVQKRGERKNQHTSRINNIKSM